MIVDKETCMEISVGMKDEVTRVVEEQYTAFHVGSGSLKVLATPSMIAFMERASLEMLQRGLPEGQSTVGTVVNVRHLAATPAGQTVRVLSEVTGVEGRRVTLKVEVWDSREKVGEGVHERYIIDVERFLQRVQLKMEPDS
jgi:fluoroacetyl-CoA thioesterase